MALVDGRAGAAASEQRRRSILEAALDVFTTVGYHATTAIAIRRRARVTTGSLYHYFPGGKPEIAAAVHVDSLRQYQTEFLPVLAAVGDDAEAGIRAGVRYHLDWIDAHPKRARFLFSDHPDEVGVALREFLRDANAEFFAAVGDWIDRHIDAGAIRPLPKQTLYALWVGPAQQIGRQLVTSQRRLRLRDTIDALSDGAWRAVRTEGQASST
jgi:AcrR family transcriptional regulator